MHILVTLPFTGSWDACKLMKTAALIAQVLINNQQLLLPGYQLVCHSFDDECSTDRVTQLLLVQRSANDSVVALAGLRCKASCRLMLPRTFNAVSVFSLLAQALSF